MFQDLSDGFNSYFKVFPLINKFHLKKYFFISGLISLLVGMLLFTSVYFLYDDLGGWIQSFWRWDFGKSYFDRASSWIAGGLISLIALLSYKYIIMIVLSPIQSIISSRVEAGLNGYATDQRVSTSSIFKDLYRGIGITLRNLTKEILFTILLLIISFIPIVAFVSGPAILLVQAYYAGFGNMDYYMERHMNVRESATFVKRHKGLAIANGGIFLAMLLIPIIGLIIAPTFATIASSVEAHKRIDDF